MIILLIPFLFFNPNIENNLVKAEPTTFNLRDGFESYIENRIYSEWTNMSEDYINYLNDSWDWDEGHRDSWYSVGFQSSGYTVESSPVGHINISSQDVPLTRNMGMYSNDWASNPLDLSEHMTVIVRFRGQYNGSNDDFKIIFGVSDDSGDFTNNDEVVFTESIYSSENWYIMFYTFTGLGDCDFSNVEQMRIIAQLPSGQVFDTYDNFDVDFIHFINDTETFTHINQERETLRASKGLYSYYHNYTSNITYYDNISFSFNPNATIKIDIPSYTVFPESISFDIWSNHIFNFSLFIENNEFLLHQETLYSNEWLDVSETIQREDYIFNSTTGSIYFELYSNHTDYLEIYIDELKITYTDSPPIFDYDFDTWLGKYGGSLYGKDYNLNYFNYNMTSQSIHAEPSGEGTYNFDYSHTRGCVYDTISNELFSRRIYHEYEIKTNSTDVFTELHQETTFNIDKEYRLEVYLKVEPEYTGGTPTQWQVLLRYFLYVDNVISDGGFTQQPIFYDYYFPNMYHFKFSIDVVQEDYNTISTVCIYKNAITGNTTQTNPYTFEINKGEDKIFNSLNIVQVNSTILYKPRIVIPFTIVKDSETIIDGKITRSIKHSDVETENPNPIIVNRPDWDGTKPFKSLFAILGYYINLFIEGLLSDFMLVAYVKEMYNFMYSTFTGWDVIFNNILGGINNLGSIMSSILSFLTANLTGVSSFLSNIWGFLSGDLSDFITDFFDNIALPFENLFIDYRDTFGEVDFFHDIRLAFEGDATDWDNLGLKWENFFGSMSISLVTNTKNMWGAFWINVMGFDPSIIIVTIVDLFDTLSNWLTLLLIMYIVYICQLIIRGDWDRLRRELTGIINIIVWVISAIVKVIHWIFEVIWAILDVAIPFT